ncbi:MAG: hypothetical protein ACKKL6_00555 [Candidatus Komeilibacteria bacterium]
MDNSIELKKPWYKKWWGVLLIIIAVIYIPPLINSKNMSDSTNTDSQNILEMNKVGNDIQIDGFSRFTSKDWGFSVLFPEEPKENTLDLPEMTIHNFQAHKLISENEPIQYNIFYSDIKNGKIMDSDSISAYLSNYASGKASASNGKLISKKDINFQEFPANEYSYMDTVLNIEMVHKGVILIVDGDAVELSVVYPSTLNSDTAKYEDFKQSFELEAIQKPLSSEYWSNGILKFKPPVNWEKKDSSQENRILTYVNEAGHSIELYESKFNNQKISCNDLQKEVGDKNIDDKGYMYRTFPNPDYNIDMGMVFKCIENNNQSFILSGKAPVNTFFRSQQIFQDLLDSFTFQ